jgi:hypothetical protein
MILAPLYYFVGISFESGALDFSRTALSDHAKGRDRDYY